jgi:hypothetical protein
MQVNRNLRYSAYHFCAENLRERVFTHVAGRSTSYIAEYILKHCRTIRIQYVETGDKYTAQWLEIDLFEEFKRECVVAFNFF